MDWLHPWFLLLIPLAVLLLVLFARRSYHPMPRAQHRALLVVRCAAVALLLIAWAGPAWELTSTRESVVIILDESASQGEEGMARGRTLANTVMKTMQADTTVSVVSVGKDATILRMPTTDHDPIEPSREITETMSSHSNFAAAVRLASGLFEPGASRRIILIGDGLETRGDLLAAAREASLQNVVIDAVPVPGETRPDVRVVRLRASRSRLHEGSDLSLNAEVESSLAGKGRVRLFENGIEVGSQAIELEVGESRVVTFKRTPQQRNLYSYRVVAEGFGQETTHANNQAMAMVDVYGRAVLLYIEGEPGEAKWLAEAMASEGIRLDTRPVEALPKSLHQLVGYDGIIISDVPADRLGTGGMNLLRDYVEQLGGGFLMIGGKNSFGVGGYYRTPIEEILPVKMKAPDKEERYATAIVIVLDRSGSMSGGKIEICKSAALATVDLLTPKDYVGVIAFDSNAHQVVPITRVTDREAIASRIATLNAGGGTNLQPGMVAAREALTSIDAKVKHMIVLTDGQTSGGNYQQMAAQLNNEGVTISSVGVGSGADVALLQAIAAAGGGEFYATQDPTNIPQIFTRDAMTHIGRLIREQPFQPRQVERHTMLDSWPSDEAPPLLGFVKTHRKATTQVPLVTDTGDPLLATWRYGLGKVVAFTSDSKSRWGAMWVTTWKDGYNQFWAQVLRETAREPQGQFMDISLDRQEEDCRILVDVMEDPSAYDNDSQVTASVSFSPARAGEAAFEPVHELTLQQTGPGRYESQFPATESGVYLVRAQADSRMVSAGLVRNPSGEAATGQVDKALLQQAANLTGGTLINPDNPSWSANQKAGFARHVELRPPLLILLVFIFLIDVCIRRWQNVQALLRR
ncbi:MAG: VWA domain-containing protein [Planctomycetota bacterium]